MPPKTRSQDKPIQHLPVPIISLKESHPMSNETPVTQERLRDLIRWHEAFPLNSNGADTMSALRELQSLRASAAKAGEGVSDVRDIKIAVRDAHIASLERQLGETDELRRQVAVLSKIDEDGPTGDYRDLLYSLLVRKGFAQHEARDISHGKSGCGGAQRIQRVIGTGGTDWDISVEDCPGCPDCAPSPEQQLLNVPPAMQTPPAKEKARQLLQQPSPEQQGAERGCCVADCTNVANDGWYCLTHAEARAAELMSRAKVTAEDEPDGCDCPHASAARSCGCGFCRALNCTPPAPALGFTADEREALELADVALKWHSPVFNHTKHDRAIAALRSMLERGGR
jgi:hypothetical protein